MGRQARVYIEGVLYFVTSKCGHAYNLFNTPSDYEDYISLIEKYKKQYGFKLFSYVLMPTYLHMLFELKNDVSISSVMHNINSLYTKIYNGKYAKKGHLFQARFRTVLAEKEYLLPLTRYIHLRPIADNAAADLREYVYSSYQKFLDSTKRLHPDMRGEIAEVFGRLGGTEKEFETFTLGGNREESEALERSLQKKQILGSAEFIARLKKMIEENVSRSKKASRKSAWVLYTAFGSVVVMILAFSAFMYRGNAEFKSRYYRTLAMYEKTLSLLESEKSRALQENRGADEYDWKIELARNALNELRTEKESRLKEEKALDGFSWEIVLKQTGGPAGSGAGKDILIFSGNTVVSLTLDKQGFSGTSYSKREKKDGTIVWETTQRNDRGERANWRGYWDGEQMTGVLKRYYRDGAARDFSFTSAGSRAEEAGVMQAVGGLK